MQQYAYYAIVTKSAERAHSGCANSVRAALSLVSSANASTLVDKLNLCTPLPAYISRAGDAKLRDELLMVYMYSFAGLNMGNYPPVASTGLAKACSLFVSTVQEEAFGEPTRAQGDGGWAALRAFLSRGYAAASQRRHGMFGRSPFSKEDAGSQHSAVQRSSQCFDLGSQLPAGPNGTVSCADWSGCGVGSNGESWDYETCKFLVEPIGTNGVSDMFPARAWTSDWLKAHCQARFGVTPAPTVLVDEWGFDAAGLRTGGASRILFTNGLNDVSRQNAPAPFMSACRSMCLPSFLFATPTHITEMSSIRVDISSISS